MARKHNPSTASFVLAAAIAGVAVAAFAYWAHGGWTRDGALEAARVTARFSFVWFVVAWVASALARLWPGGWRAQLLFRRRAVGLGFAAAHTVHLGALLIATLVFAASAELPKVLGGGLGYVFVAAMALTSHDGAVRALGQRNWKLLHATGGYVLAAIFAYSYYNGLSEKPLVAAPAFAFISAAALLRLAAWAKSRAGAARATPTSSAPPL